MAIVSFRKAPRAKRSPTDRCGWDKTIRIKPSGNARDNACVRPERSRRSVEQPLCSIAAHLPCRWPSNDFPAVARVTSTACSRSGKNADRSTCSCSTVTNSSRDLLRTSESFGTLRCVFGGMARVRLSRPRAGLRSEAVGRSVLIPVMSLFPSCPLFRPFVLVAASLSVFYPACFALVVVVVEASPAR